MALRFALLGTGHWAAQTHAVAIAGHPEAELVTVWGRDRAKAAALAEAYGARGHDDLDAAIAGVDAVAIALPPDIQAPMAAHAARAGKHLLLDKPVALDVPAADDVVDAVRDAGVASVVFFTRRFMPQVVRFLDDMTTKGGWDGARVTMLTSIFGANSPYRDSTWRSVHGGLWDLGPHALSLLLPVLGPVDTVTAAPGPHTITHVVLGHAGGASSTMTLGLAMPPAAEHQEFTFYGAFGEAPAPPEPDDPVQALGSAIDGLRDEVATGRRDHPCGVRFGREVVAILAAAQQARDQGVRVHRQASDRLTP